MEYPDKIYEQLAETLASCYRSIDWAKAGAKARRNKEEHFATRIRSSGNERTVPAAIDRLAKRCNVGCFDMELDAVAYLAENEKEVRRRLRTESVYVALLAAKLVKEMKVKK